MRSARMLVLAAALAVLPAADARALVVADGKIYWIKHQATSRSSSRTAGIGRANIDGTKVKRAIVRGIQATDIAVSRSHVYWSTRSSRKRAPIGRARLDGTRIQRQLLRVNAGPLAVDDDHLYWGEPRAIGRAKLNGTKARRTFIRLPGSSWGVADVAVGAGHVFWSEGLASKKAWDQARETRGPTGRLGRAGLDGNGAVRAWTTWHRSALMTSGADILGVDDQTIYWLTTHPDNKLEYAFAGSPESIGACQPVLSNCKTLIALTDEGFNPNSQFAVADGYVYWADPVSRGTRIYRAALQREGGSSGISVGHERRGRPELVVSLPDSVS